MGWIPWEVITKGGPWVLMVLLLGAFVMALTRGLLIRQADVDRTVGGYREVIAHQERELSYWRQAAARKDETIATLSSQTGRLMVNADLSTYALREVLAAAGRQDTPHDLPPT